MLALLLAMTFTDALWTAVGTIITTIFVFLFNLFRVWLMSKIKNEKFRAAFGSILNLIESSVIAIQQTFVEQMKKTGKFDAQAQKEAFNKVFAQVKESVSDESMKIIESMYGDFDAWLTTQIEAVVNKAVPHSTTSETKTILG